jgi:glutaredoxin
MRALFAGAIAVVVLVGASGCHRKDDSKADEAAAVGSAEVPTLPKLVLMDDTPNTLLTWVDAQGDFHVVEHVADVPAVARDAVRVALTSRTDTTGEAVYVADLTHKLADGSYEVKTMPRASWDEIGASKRKARLEALAPSAAPPAPSGAPSAADGAHPSPSGVKGEITAIIYGASWCGPCHQAEALLKSLGVKVTKKDIEQSEGAEQEMQAVLRRVHRHGGSIPVIDIMGQVFVGFSEGALRGAVERARNSRL